MVLLLVGLLVLLQYLQLMLFLLVYHLVLPVYLFFHSVLMMTNLLNSTIHVQSYMPRIHASLHLF